MGGLDRMIENWEQAGVATGDPDADALLQRDGNALLIGVLLDQQMRAEIAFSGPLKLRERLGHVDMRRLANMSEEELAKVFQEKPAIHRFPKSMAERTQKLARTIVEEYDGHAANLWKDEANEETIRKRASTLPGFGKAKVLTLMHALTLFGHRQSKETTTQTP